MKLSQGKGDASLVDGSLPGTVHTRVATPMLPTACAAAAASAATASRLRPAAAAAPATCAFVQAMGGTIAHEHAKILYKIVLIGKLCPKHLAHEQAPHHLRTLQGQHEFDEEVQTVF